MRGPSVLFVFWQHSRVRCWCVRVRHCCPGGSGLEYECGMRVMSCVGRVVAQRQHHHHASCSSSALCFADCGVCIRLHAFKQPSPSSWVGMAPIWAHCGVPAVLFWRRDDLRLSLYACQGSKAQAGSTRHEAAECGGRNLGCRPLLQAHLCGVLLTG
jgi:hypothetical protein